MKLAEALILRADAQKRIEHLKQRLLRNAKVQEGDTPAENPRDLIAELDRVATDLTRLIQQINRTNAASTLADGTNVSDALARRDVLANSGHGQWSHAAVQAQFSGLLINQRKRYPPDLRDTLSRAFSFRQTADYESEGISEIQAERLIRRTRAFLAAVQQET